METSEDKQWASRYLLDPLTAPEPSQETGPGTHYGSTFAPAPAADKEADAQSKDSKGASVSVTPVTNHRQALAPSHTRSSSLGRPSTEVPTSSTRTSVDGRHAGQHARASSLGARLLGEDARRPLDIIRRDSKKANRAPHLRKKQQIGVDHIDRLDSAGLAAYHHGSAYDAASLARNQNPRDGPVWAVTGTNREALRATPRERVLDSIKRHRPLDGVAMTPPGQVGPNGRVLNYEEGTDMMIDLGGNYKRWPGVEYHPEDLKGKGEPSFSIERALKDRHHPTHGRHASDGAVELSDRSSQRDSTSTVAASTGSAIGGLPNNEPRSSEAQVKGSASGRSSGQPAHPSVDLRRRKEVGSG